MDWEKQEQSHQQELQGNGNGGNNNNGLFVKVMTDEQMEILRKQIAVYATICQQLIDLHKSITSNHDPAGVRLGSLYCDPLVTSGINKISGRQRWTPTPTQLQILERIFDRGNGAPSKQKIKEITSDLSQHGQISETNVYNWFQNRRARSKRKQQVSLSNNNGESEVETEVESPNEKKVTRSEDLPVQNNSGQRSDQNSEIRSGMSLMDVRANKMEPPFSSNANLTPAVSSSQMSFYESMLSNPRMDHLVGKMEVPVNHNSYVHAEDYNMTG